MYNENSGINVNIVSWVKLGRRVENQLKKGFIRIIIFFCILNYKDEVEVKRY